MTAQGPLPAGLWALQLGIWWHVHTDNVQLCFFVIDEDAPGSMEKDWPSIDTSTFWGRDALLRTEQFPGFTQALRDIPVLTTADVYPQERHRMFPVVYAALDMACKRKTGKGLPVELAMDIVNWTQVGMSRAEAEMHRRLLMKDRTANNVKTDQVCNYTNMR